MKRGSIEHPKTLRLARLLGIRRLEAAGLLEALFHFTAKLAPQGNVGKWGDDEIAAGIYCECAEPAALVGALVESGWLHVHSEHRLIVHDWHEHADQAVQKLLRRKGLPFLSHLSGQCPPARPDMSGQFPEMDSLARGSGTGSGTGTGAGSGQAAATPKPPCEIGGETLVTLYHELCPSMPRITTISGSRIENFERAAREHPDIAWWREVFRAVEKSAFLRGFDAGGARKWPGATLDWLTTDDRNAVAVAEGTYSQQGTDASSEKEQSARRGMAMILGAKRQEQKVYVGR